MRGMPISLHRLGYKSSGHGENRITVGVDASPQDAMLEAARFRLRNPHEVARISALARVATSEGYKAASDRRKGAADAETRKRLGAHTAPPCSTSCSPATHASCSGVPTW